MKKVLFSAASVFALFVAMTAIAAEKDKGKSIKDVMTEAHKGKPALCAKANKGEASKTEAETLVTLYEAMAKNAPPKGDKEEWKKKCEALIAGAKKLVSDQKDTAAYKAAVNCKSCHDAHK